MPGCVFPKDWSLGPATSFPELARLRGGTRELGTESYLLASQGHYSQAIANQALGFQIARDAANEPTLIAYLVDVAIDAITPKGLQNILYLSGGNAGVDQQITQAIPSDWKALSVSYALRGEVVNVLTVFAPLQKHPETISSAMQPASAKPQALPPDQARFVANLVDAVEARYFAKLFAFLKTAPPADNVVIAPSPNWGVVDVPVMSFNPVVTWGSQLTFTDFQAILNKAVTIRAIKQVTLAAAAVLAAKAQTGTFPDTLPGNFVDPYGGKSLSYRREGSTGFVVYSIGPQGTFDGGKPGQYRFTPFQVFFRYPGPPPQPVQ